MASLKLRVIRARTVLVVPLYWYNSLVAIELNNLKRHPGEKGYNKARVGGGVPAFSWLDVPNNKFTIITESFSNACVHALFGCSSIILHGINNLRHLGKILNQKTAKDPLIWLDAFHGTNRAAGLLKDVKATLPDVDIYVPYVYQPNNWDINDELIEANLKNRDLTWIYDKIVQVRQESKRS